MSELHLLPLPNHHWPWTAIECGEVVRAFIWDRFDTCANQFECNALAMAFGYLVGAALAGEMHKGFEEARELKSESTR